MNLRALWQLWWRSLLDVIWLSAVLGVFSTGDSLASVAFGEYGDPTAWRALAAFNEIDDPLRVPTGRVLLLPTPEELAPTLAGAR